MARVKSTTTGSDSISLNVNTATADEWLKAGRMYQVINSSKTSARQKTRAQAILKNMEESYYDDE